MADDPTLNLGDGTGTAVLGGIVNYLQAGGSVVRVLIAGWLGAFVAPFLAITDVINGIGNFFSTPFLEGGDAVGALINGIFTAPGDLLETGARISEGALQQFFAPSIAGLLGLPVAVGLTMLSLFVVNWYLSEPETGDTLPGLPFDVPDVLGLEFGVEEETDDEDADNIG